MRTKVGDWVVCIGVDGSLLAWGRVTYAGKHHSDVRYGKSSPPLWGNSWENKYLKVKKTEKLAEKAYHDYWNSIECDPR